MTTAPPTYSARNSQLLDAVLISAIRVTGANPRRSFDEEALAQLTESVRALGVLEPLLLRTSGDDAPADQPYDLIAGERRLRAATAAGLQDVPARVLEDLSDADALKIALIENLQRQDLDPLDEAAGYARLNREAGMTQAAIAAAVNRSQPAIANAMRLLDLPDDVQERIRAAELSVSHGVALAKYKAFPKVASAVARIAVENGATTKDLESGLGRIGSYALEQSGVLQRIGSYEQLFPKSVCEACPFGANVDGYCLKPEHWTELQNAADKERQAEVSRVIAQAKAGGAKIPKLDKLGYDKYQEFHGHRPPGCDQRCACNGHGINHAGVVVPICTNPKRFRSLQNATENAKKKDRRETGAATLEQALGAVSTGTEAPTSRDLAMLVFAVLERACRQQPKMLQAAADRHLDGLDLKAFDPDWTSWSPEKAHLSTYGKLDVLSGFSVGQLARFATELLLRDRIHETYDLGYGGGARSATTDWYLGARQDGKPELEHEPVEVPA